MTLTYICLLYTSADDHAILRTGLKLLLSNEESVEVVGEASNGNEVLELTEKIPADVLILDLSMPGVHGLDVIKELKEHNNPINILVLTMHSDCLLYTSKTRFELATLALARRCSTTELFPQFTVMTLYIIK